LQSLIITPLEEELSFLAQSLRAQGLSENIQSVGRLTGHCFPKLVVMLALGGHGKAQSALQTQHLIDHSERIDLVICAGAAGALAPGIAVGDLVVAETTIEHDYLLRFVQRPSPQFAGSQETLSRLRSSQYDLHPAQVHYGIIASGDEDIVAIERAQELHLQTGALAVAWEGAGVARACCFSGIPYLEIRGITDTADHDAPAAFETNLSIAMENLGRFLVQVITSDRGDFA
jgi:adenosylhomocysteine nucleosidase